MDPFVLFGLERDTCTLKDAKLAYYDLAQVYHPDKAHSSDKDVAVKEMQVLNEQYKLVVRNLQARDIQREVESCEDLRKHYQDAIHFIDRSQMPSFQQVFIETHEEFAKFNEVWENKVAEESSFAIPLSDGYGDYMVKDETRILDYDPEPDMTPVQEFEKESGAIISIENVQTLNKINSLYDLNTQKRDDHTTDKCFDYRLAFSERDVLAKTSNK